MNKQYKAQSWARQIKEISEATVGRPVDVFDNSRKRTVVQYRSLHIYMMRKFLKMSLYDIRDFYIANKMSESYNHASVIHAIKMFDLYKHYDPYLMECLMVIMNGHKDEEETLQNFIAKLNYIHPTFYREIRPIIDMAYDKTAELNIQKIKEKINDIQSKNN